MITKLNKPWLHFILLGTVFYQLQSTLLPTPKTVIGPLSEARINSLQQQWQTSTGGQASALQTVKLISTELDRDMLFQRGLEQEFHLHDPLVFQRLIRNMKFLQLADNKSNTELFDQALQMGLHLDDTVIKRRLIQAMEQQLLARFPPPKITIEEIKTEFNNRFTQLRRPPFYSIEHIFFSHVREHEAKSVVALITQQGLDFQAAQHLGAPFLQGQKFTRQTPRQLTQNFGKGFALALEQAKPQAKQWLGPIRSAFGLHYVWINAVAPARDAQLDEVERQLRIDLEYLAQKQALRTAIEALRDEYDVQEIAISTAVVEPQ